MTSNQRGQSETVGIIIFTGVIILLSALVGTVLLSEVSTEETPRIDIKTDLTDTNVTLTHSGGDQLNASRLRVLLTTDTGERRFRMNRANLTDNDWQYGPADALCREHGLSGDSMDILVIDTDTNTVLLDTFELFPEES
jgi:FlaG/FlaF family flagellin (archaellin)